MARAVCIFSEADNCLEKMLAERKEKKEKKALKALVNIEEKVELKEDKISNLKDISLDIPRGSLVAIVGKSIFAILQLYSD